MTTKVYITRKFPDEALAKIREHCHVRIWDEEDIPVPREVLMQEVADADGLLCMLTEQVDEAVLASAPRLRVVSNLAVGYNNINVAAATSLGIAVTNTPGVLTETTADLAFALLLATSRRLVEASDYLRAGKWKAWSPMQMTGQDVYGATLGIIGMGRIGEAVARRALGFGMKVLYFNRSRKLDSEREYGVTYCELSTLLTESDFVVTLTPHTPETANLIDREQLALMKSTAVLINPGRGGIVNEAALYEALAGGQIWAAGLDVFEHEPVSPDHPLLTLPNVVALPHIGSASVQTRKKMAMMAAQNVILGVTGRMPNELVNPEVEAAFLARWSV
ncbi:2-hydroxyacid dehydrogenase [Paenibacillus xerothermodurans]|uniref:D-glycerate dehydrogenase n=1 Tax=Paenibacillus xerothermodurans TaxID=1977292 RepID=A0A2W1NP68_PAEXE|nr:D-glycerate dehydrogenase [Paenibacillus xerothermodurans]PZE21275.1 D-glycerate dehydrogenase [Paenibacillus xerothermodurans]